MSMILETTNLCKSFRGQTAVNNLSLNVEKYAILGLTDKRIDEVL